MSNANAAWPKRCATICASARRRRGTPRRRPPLKSDGHRHCVPFAQAFSLSDRSFYRQQPTAALLVRKYRRPPSRIADTRFHPCRSESLAPVEPLSRDRGKADAIRRISPDRQEKPSSRRGGGLPAPQRRRDGKILHISYFAGAGRTGTGILQI